MSLQAIDATRKGAHLGGVDRSASKYVRAPGRAQPSTAPGALDHEPSEGIPRTKPSSGLLKELLSGLHANPERSSFSTIRCGTRRAWDSRCIAAAVLELLGQCSEFIDALVS